MFYTSKLFRTPAAAISVAEGRRLPVRLLLGALLQDPERAEGGRGQLPVHRQEQCGQHHQRNDSSLRRM